MLMLLEVCSFLWTDWWGEVVCKGRGKNTPYVGECIALSY